MYELIWTVVTGDHGYGRKALWPGGEQPYPPCSYDEIMDFFLAPEVADMGNELVIWEEAAGITTAEGWRKIDGA